MWRQSLLVSRLVGYNPAMPVEIEAKFQLTEPEAMRRLLAELGAEALGAVLEQNTYFDRADRSLQGRDCGLRLRVEQAGGEASRVMLTYKGPRRPGELKIRQEEEVGVSSAKATRAILAGLGYEPTLSFQKRRERYRLGRAVVCLDELPELGFFLEIEAPDERAVQDVRKTLGLGDVPTVRASYIALVAEHLGRSGRAKLRF